MCRLQDDYVALRLILHAGTNILKNICQLTVDCINFENKTIKVEKSLYKGEIIRHRNKYQVRDVHISDELCKILKPEIKPENDLLFPNSDGNVQDPDNMIKRRFNPVIRKAGIREQFFLSVSNLMPSSSQATSALIQQFFFSLANSTLKYP
ncbi:MAG TPA: tyrosine-type recombinase/integrase, partial [Candidatus Gastranaerophilales bacterium]|nr:tyrosine-type recombinase/integrase [Candidatus Gastranaerophilales bacterium]